MRIALALIVLGVLVYASAPTSAVLPGVARFRETQITHVSKGEGAGAIEVWRTRIWLLKKPQTIGTGLIACIRADNHTDIQECQSTYVLPRGRIQLAGEIITRVAFQLTIVGGTGVYNGAGGVGVFTGLPNPAAVTFFLE